MHQKSALGKRIHVFLLAVFMFETGLCPDADWLFGTFFLLPRMTSADEMVANCYIATTFYSFWHEHDLGRACNISSSKRRCPILSPNFPLPWLVRRRRAKRAVTKHLVASFFPYSFSLHCDKATELRGSSLQGNPPRDGGSGGTAFYFLFLFLLVSDHYVPALFFSFSCDSMR